MKNTVVVKGNKTLGKGDDGTVQCVEVAATITFPLESTWKYKKGDEFVVVSNADGDVSIVGEDGVTLIPAGITLTAKGKGATIKYEGKNKYLVWASVCLVAVVGALAYSYSIIPDSAMQLINWNK